ncbi:MAG: hypothetical protein SOI04_02570 [Bifidobacterium thermacidophilum]|uniref:hypothetical protein n=1 Tax=Bifidobacterium thermacidophilum TaxID=246618 RepID=UPI002F35CE15
MALLNDNAVDQSPFTVNKKRHPLRNGVRCSVELRGIEHKTRKLNQHNGLRDVQDIITTLFTTHANRQTWRYRSRATVPGVYPYCEMKAILRTQILDPGARSMRAAGVIFVVSLMMP